MCFWQDYQDDPTFRNMTLFLKHRAYVKQIGSCKEEKPTSTWDTCSACRWKWTPWNGECRVISAYVPGKPCVGFWPSKKHQRRKRDLSGRGGA